MGGPLIEDWAVDGKLKSSLEWPYVCALYHDIYFYTGYSFFLCVCTHFLKPSIAAAIPDSDLISLSDKAFSMKPQREFQV